MEGYILVGGDVAPPQVRLMMFCGEYQNTVEEVAAYARSIKILLMGEFGYTSEQADRHIENLTTDVKEALAKNDTFQNQERFFSGEISYNEYRSLMQKRRKPVRRNLK